jgi:hypothetical protein
VSEVERFEHDPKANPLLTYSVSAVLRARKVDHAIQAGETCAATLIRVRVELLLG